MNFIHRRAQAVPYPVIHALHMEHKEIPMDMQSVQARLSGLPGVISVDGDLDSEIFRITYDLRQVHLQEIETAFQSMGMELEHGFLPYCRNKILHFIETLEDNNQFALSHRPDHAHTPSRYRHLQQEEERQ